MIVLKSIIVWLVFIVIESINGTIRVALLLPWLGEQRAEILSFLTGAIVVVAIATLFMPWLRASKITSLLGIGLLWMVLTVVFEVMLGRMAFGYSWSQIVAQFDVSHNILMPLELVVLVLAPLLARSIRSQIHHLTQPND